MAESKEKVVQEEKSEGSVYPASELTQAAEKAFGTSKDCVAAALKYAGKSEATISEAKKIINSYIKTEVR